MLKKTLMLALPVAVVAALGFGVAAYADEPAADVAEPEVATQEVAAEAADEPAADIAAQARNGWYESSSNVWYYYVNDVIQKGWLDLDGKRYYLDPAAGGRRVYGPFVVDGKSQFFGDDGALITAQGWQYSNYRHAWSYIKADGTTARNTWLNLGGKWYYFNNSLMVTGIAQIGDKWYCFSDTGAWISQQGAYYSAAKDEWYCVKADGTVANKGWVKINNKWYYVSGGKALSHCYMDMADGYRYYFNKDASMATGWFAIDWWGEPAWAYANTNGHAVKNGWVSSGGKWYYIDGYTLLQNCIFEVGGNEYFANAQGVMQTGWIKDDDDWYYAGSNGKLITDDWLSYNGKWYYFQDVFMVTGPAEINGATYFFGDDGAMLANAWHSEVDPYSGKTYWFYIGSDGKVVEGGWVKAGGYWYYAYGAFPFLYWAGADGYSWKEIDGVSYYFDEKWHMVTNSWVEDTIGYHYMTSSGAEATGWLKIDGKWYYFEPYNANYMAANKTMVIDGVTYVFDAHGNWTKR